MAQPPRFLDSTNPSHVCKLTKVIYGLKQASRAWYDELKNYLTSIVLQPTISDPSLFKFSLKIDSIYVLIYVDGIIVTGSNSHLSQCFIHSFSNRFSLKDLGDLSYFLGVEVIPNSNGLFIFFILK